MDSLLTGYGSDSDESTSSAAVKSGDNQVGSISNLLGDGIDSCSSDDEEEEVDISGRNMLKNTEIRKL